MPRSVRRGRPLHKTDLISTGRKEKENRKNH
jgi:hypothetical protein